jgi:hypothetical protein
MPVFLERNRRTVMFSIARRKLKVAMEMNRRRQLRKTGITCLTECTPLAASQDVAQVILQEKMHGCDVM